MGQCLEATVQRVPDKEALVVYQENIRLTFAQLKEEVGPGLNPKGGQVLGGGGWWNCRDSSRLWGWEGVTGAA